MEFINIDWRKNNLNKTYEMRLQRSQKLPLIKKEQSAQINKLSRSVTIPYARYKPFSSDDRKLMETYSIDSRKIVRQFYVPERSLMIRDRIKTESLHSKKSQNQMAKTKKKKVRLDQYVPLYNSLEPKKFRPIEEALEDVQDDDPSLLLEDIIVQSMYLQNGYRPQNPEDYVSLANPSVRDGATQQVVRTPPRSAKLPPIHTPKIS